MFVLGYPSQNFFFVVFFYVLLIKYTKNSIINSVILIDENSGRNAFRPGKKKRVPPISFVLDTTKYISMELQGLVPCKNYIPTMSYKYKNKNMILRVPMIQELIAGL